MASRISKSCVDEIVSRTDIVSLIGEYCNLTQRGNDWWGCCPFHQEKTPSFKVSEDKKIYYCFGCHAGGNAITFMIEYNKFSYVEALQELARRANVEISYEDGSSPVVDSGYERREQYIELYTRVASAFNYWLLNREGGKFALKYILDRGLTLETIQKFNLGWSPSDGKWLHRFLKKQGFSDEFLSDSGLFSKKYPEYSVYTDRFMFPIRDRRGRVVAFGGRLLHPKNDGTDRKYINSPELPWYKKGEILFAFDMAKQHIQQTKQVIFCEGYMDAIAYHQCGFTNAVAPLGTALTEEQVRLVKRFANTVLLSFDSDEAGQKATERAILMCRHEDLEVKIIQLKQGKDSAEIMLNYGVDTLTSDVNSAIIDSDYLLEKLLKKYSKDTPDGKAHAAAEFFNYIDVLQSSVQKSASMEQLCRVFNLNPEAAKRDFINRKSNQRMELENQRQERVESADQNQLKIGQELRALFAIISDISSAADIIEQLTADDFEDSSARNLFIVLKECCNNKNLSLENIISRCDKELQRPIVEMTSTGEFSKNAAKAVQDSFVFLKKRSLERKRLELGAKISAMSPASDEDILLLQNLLKEKMDIDKLIEAMKG